MVAEDDHHETLPTVSLVDRLVGLGSSNVRFDSQTERKCINGRARNHTALPQSGEVDLGDYWFRWGKISSLSSLSSDGSATSETEGMFVSGCETRVDS